MQRSKEEIGRRLAELRKRARQLVPQSYGSPEEMREEALRCYFAWQDLRERANATLVHET